MSAIHDKLDEMGVPRPAEATELDRLECLKQILEMHTKNQDQQIEFLLNLKATLQRKAEGIHQQVEDHAAEVARLQKEIDTLTLQLQSNG